MKRELFDAYKERKLDIKNRLLEFRKKSQDSWFDEFRFCLLTPQSNAQRCWEAVEQLKELKNPSKREIANILSKKTRFHNIKSKRILNANNSWNNIKHFLIEENRKELRNTLAKEVNGYGLKEASHFLRNIGKSDNQIAILDRHILRNLHKEGIIEDTKIRSQKHYLEIEEKFLDYSKKVGIPSDELDILWWSQENGEIFK